MRTLVYTLMLTILFSITWVISVRAALITANPKTVLLAKAANTVTTPPSGAEAVAFSETFSLKRGSCVIVHFSSEVRATDDDGDFPRLIRFSIELDGNNIGPHPEFHHTGFIPDAPEIVTVNAYACDVPRGQHTLEVIFASDDPDDVARVGFRTLEIWLATP